MFRDSFRVLRRCSGGRLAISDVVATAALPEETRADMDLYSGCISGAADIETLERLLAEAGFTAIEIRPVEESHDFIRDWQPGTDLEEYVASASIQAIKP